MSCELANALSMMQTLEMDPCEGEGLWLILPDALEYVMQRWRSPGFYEKFDIIAEHMDVVWRLWSVRLEAGRTPWPNIIHKQAFDWSLQVTMDDFEKQTRRIEVVSSLFYTCICCLCINYPKAFSLWMVLQLQIWESYNGSNTMDPGNSIT